MPGEEGAVEGVASTMIRKCNFKLEYYKVLTAIGDEGGDNGRLHV